MDPLIGGTLISAGSSLVNGLLGQGQAKKNQQRQFDHNMQMADLAWQRNLEMWNKNNAYNTPQAQMDRFTKAGLNKNLIYGQGTPGNSTTTPQYQVDKTDMQQVPGLNIGDTLGQYNSFRIANAQVDRMEQQTKLDKQKELNAGIQNLILGHNVGSAKAKANIDEVLSSYAQEIQQNIVTKGQKEIGKIIQDTEQSKSKTTFQKMLNDRARKTGIFPGDNNTRTFIQMLDKLRTSGTLDKYNPFKALGRTGWDKNYFKN